ncbi:hypothetical protein H9P43_010052 [Blastocladiella emersonii ATCC 22665]|nr:hypothetical protein H9P43_010052 [Blastocladiella emersonii ATCC 22665]
MVGSRFGLRAALVAAVAGYAAATPFLHTVNQQYPNGTMCELPSFLDQSCPQLCASDVAKCPDAYRPKCPAGTTYCVDGTCQASCPADAVSPCACPSSFDSSFDTYKSWYPCMADAGKPETGLLVVNLTKVQPTNRADRLLEVCNAQILRSAADKDATAFLACPVRVVPAYTLDLPIWKSFWGMLGIQATVIAFFLALKTVSERSIRKAADAFAAGSGSDSDEPLAAATAAPGEKQLLEHFRHDSFFDVHALPASTKIAEKAASVTPAKKLSPSDPGYIRFAYYVNHPLGTLGFYLSVAWILYLQVFLALTVYDYYGSLSATPTVLFYLTDYQIPFGFVFAWHFMVITLVVWRIGGVVTVRNWFRIRVRDVHQAQFVVVTRRIDAIRATDHAEKGFIKGMLALVAAVERLADQYLKFSLKVTAHQVHISQHVRVPYFYDECIRYVYNPLVRDFTPYPYSLGDGLSELAALGNATADKGGLPTETVDQRQDLIGLNEIDIPARSFVDLWTSEVGGWFYLYQGSCLWVWYYFSYWQMGLVLTVVILIASLIKTRVSFKSHRRIRMLASMTTNVTVLRNGAWTVVDSRALAPGDVVQVSAGVLSVDVLLCRGQALLDESSLTGESRPIRKFPAPTNDESSLSFTHHKRHILLAGTGILQADEGAYGLVLKTNVNTSRGQLIQKMLHPTPITFVFDEQLKVVLVMMLTWGVLCFSMVLYEMGNGTIASWFYALFIISEIISPLLPAVLVAGQSVAADRLVSKHQVYCIDLPRITMAGKTQLFCFDKTGTLTKEGLDMWGFLPASASLPNGGGDGDASSGKLIELQSDYARLGAQDRLGLATAHSLTAHERQLLGNPVDVSMFEFTGCALQGDDVTAATGESLARIVKRYEFIHAKQTMASLVESTVDKKLHIFVKGSYEKIRAMCVPGSIPAWYDEMARGYAKRGGYVLALASKPCSLSIDAAIHQDRDDVERDVSLMGLVVFRNTLKPDTKDAIDELHRGLCRTVMISGDNVFTCVYIARECGLTPIVNEQYARCIYADIAGAGEDSVTSSRRNSNTSSSASSSVPAPGSLVWRDVDTEEIISPAELDALWQQRNVKALDLAASGPAWAKLVDSGDADKYLLSFRVWGRMSPEQKIDVVKRHMADGLIVAMCGDGGNDCGALNAAHVGVALSEAEASIVAPFSSKTKSVRSCVDLIAEGRAALASSFAGFKFLIMYGMTMSSFCLVQYYFSVVLPQWVWIYIDGIIVVSTIYALTQAKALKHLEPRRPTAQLLGPQTILSILSQAAVNWTYLFLGIYWLFQQDWFRCNEFDASAVVDLGKWWLLGDNYESTMISAIVVCQFINNGAVFNFGHYFRRSWFSNRVYALLYVVLLTVISTLILSDPSAFTCLFRINCGSPSSLVELGYPKPTWSMDPYNSLLGHNVLPVPFRWKLFTYVMSNVVLGLCIERLVILGPVREYIRTKYPLSRKYIPL